jgi:hypothetical protein
MCTALAEIMWWPIGKAGGFNHWDSEAVFREIFRITA